eukprot:698617-Hanusia_phi.AAC.2
MKCFILRKNAKRFLLGCTAAVIGAAGLQYNLKNLTAACEQKNSPKNGCCTLLNVMTMHPKEGEQKPKAIRYIILVRHGQYKDKETKDSNAVLTLKGRQQARILAQKILDTWKPTSLIVSDMTRAQQTMEILLEKLPKDIPLTTMKELREGRPCQPIPPSSSGLFQKSVVEADGARIDKAFNRIFYRAPVEQEHHSYEVVVCHANVIRYFVCKALQIPTEVIIVSVVSSETGTGMVKNKPSTLLSYRKPQLSHTNASSYWSILGYSDPSFRICFAENAREYPLPSTNLDHNIVG